MSEVGSNSSAEEITNEEIEEIQIEEDTAETEERPVSADPQPTENIDDDPPIEIMAAPVKPAEEAAPAAAPITETETAPVTETEAAPVTEAAPAAEPAAAPAPEPEAAPVAEPEAAPAAEAVVKAESEAAPVVEAAAAAPSAVVIEDVADVEEVPRDPPMEPPIARMMAGMAAGAAAGSAAAADEDEEEDDDDIDETLTERLIGLTEMFPNFMRTGTVSLVKGSWSTSQTLYSFTRSAAWIFFSSAAILIMPVMIETERLSIMDAQKAQKTQMLLGPGVAGGGAGPAMGPPPI